MRHLLILLFTVSFLGSSAQSDYQSSVEKMKEFMFKLNKYYVDSIDNEKVTEDAIKGILTNLDPHSIYIPSDELKEMNEPLKGNFEGVGIQFNILRDTIFVITPISGGPSEKVGLRPGDRIVKVDGENVAGIDITNSDVQKYLKGPKGTKVIVGVKREGEKKILDFEITRDKIPIYSVDAWYMASPKTGYIKLNRFAATTKEELQVAFNDLKGQGMKNLILDLKGNGGGYLRTAIQLADEFLSENKLVVFTEGRNYPKDETFSTKEGNFEEGKLAILIDEGSASASEIVSGAVQDWDRGVIIGRRSFGKGLVQKPLSLGDGSAIRLTTQKYYTPSGRCIQKPYEEGNEAYRNERLERFEKGELTSLDSIAFPDSLRFLTRNNRVVYGGGGILPDIFVPLDTNNTSEYYSKVLRKGLMNTFSLTYADKNRNEFMVRYKTDDIFFKDFDVKTILPEFIEFCKVEGIEYVEDDYRKSEIFFKTRIKALIARSLWGRSAFYKIINPIIPAYKKAMEVMKDDTFRRLNLAQSE